MHEHAYDWRKRWRANIECFIYCDVTYGMQLSRASSEYEVRSVDCVVRSDWCGRRMARMLPASRGHTNRQSDRPAAKLIEINIQRLRDSDVMCKYRKTSDRSRARLQAGSRIQAGGGGRRIMGRMHRCASMSVSRVLDSIKTFIYFRYGTRIGFRFQLR